MVLCHHTCYSSGFIIKLEGVVYERVWNPQKHRIIDYVYNMLFMPTISCYLGRRGLSLLAAISWDPGRIG